MRPPGYRSHPADGRPLGRLAVLIGSYAVWRMFNEANRRPRLVYFPLVVQSKPFSPIFDCQKRQEGIEPVKTYWPDDISPFQTAARVIWLYWLMASVTLPNAAITKTSFRAMPSRTVVAMLIARRIARSESRIQRAFAHWSAGS